MPELSIIVPVYKVEAYLSECIDSILAQTFKDFELILIDDGSPDRCGEICDEYAAKDSRIVVIHQKNQGVSAARNTGLNLARGNYVGFVDSDDWIEPDMYHTLIAAAIDRNASLVACCYCKEDERVVQLEDSTTKTEFLGGKNLILDLFSKPSTLMGSCCNKLFSSQTIGSIRFVEGMTVWEDLIFLQACYLQENEGELIAVKLSKGLYHYRSNVTSATNTISKTRYEKKQFKDYIFDRLLCYDRNCAEEALSYFLDSSIQLIHRYQKVATERWGRKAIFQIRRHILYWVVRSMFQHLLSPSLRNRFLVEGVLKPF